MGTIMKVALGGIGAIAALGVGGFAWANWTVSQKMAQTYDPHRIELAFPTPLTESEVDALREERAAALTPEQIEAGVDPMEGVDLDALATERAAARGEHLVASRYACIECHGDDFGGGTMLDDPAMGTWKGPNLTLGAGSVTLEYSAADWDRIVRHGVKRDGTPAIMPSEDFFSMSDQELSDIVTYIRSMPPVDATVPAPTFGPVGTMLAATGTIVLSADQEPANATIHAPIPPQAANTREFGEHLSKVCTGCHRHDLDGGPIPFGPPDWAPAGNLTPHEEGLAGWAFEDFDSTMRTGKRPDGTALLPPMDLMAKYASEMDEVEMQALWTYLQSLEAKPTGM